MGRFRRLMEPFRGISKEEELTAAVVDRIRVRGENEFHLWEATNGRGEQDFERLLRRLKPILDDLALPVEDMVRRYNNKLNSVMLRPASNLERGDLDKLGERLEGAGFVRLQDGAWVLPPAKTRQDLKPQDVRAWVAKTVPSSPTSGSTDDFSSVELVDLRQVSDGGAQSQLVRSAIGSLDMSQILPAMYIWRYMKGRRLTLAELINRGDVVFLASVFSDQETLTKLQRNKSKATERILEVCGGTHTSMRSIAELSEPEIATAFGEFVPHPEDFAQRLKIEARYWQKLLE